MAANRSNGVKLASHPQYLEIAGKRMVLLEAADFERLAQLADVWEPRLPAPNERGNYPIEVMDVELARDILRHRRRLGLSQAELARRARIAPKSLNLIERAKRLPSEAALKKIERALRQIEKEK